MLLMNLKRQVCGAVSAIRPAAMATASHAETMDGATVESRVLSGFKVGDGAIGQMKPDSYVAEILPKSPVAESNPILALINRHVILDAADSLGSPSSGPTVAIWYMGAKRMLKAFEVF